MNDTLSTLGQATAGYGSATASGANVPSLLPDIGQRLAQIGGMLADAEAELASLSDRLFGPAPRAVAGSSSGQKEREGGAAQDLIATLEALTSRSINVRSEAQRLNGRI